MKSLLPGERQIATICGTVPEPLIASRGGRRCARRRHAGLTWGKRLLVLVGLLQVTLAQAQTGSGAFTVNAVTGANATSCTATNGSVTVTISSAKPGTGPYDVSVDNGATWVRNDVTPVSWQITVTGLQWGNYPVAIRDATNAIVYPGFASVGGCTFDACSADNTDQFTGPVVPGATSYTWTTTRGTIASGQSTRTVTLNLSAVAPGSTGQVCVTPNGPTCTSPPTCFGIRVKCPEICNNGIDDDLDGLSDCADPDCGKPIANAGVDRTICAGSSATLTAGATGGAGGYTYSWMPGGSAGASISVSPIATTDYTVTATDANGCTHADVVRVNVITNVTSPGTITGAETQCAGFDPALITSTAASGGAGGTIAYQWQTSPDGATWTDIAGATAATYDPTAITATTHYRRGARRDGSCAFSYSAGVIKTVISNVTSPGTIAGAETQCAGFDPAIITSTAASGGAGGTIAYQWQSSLDGSTWADIAGATAATYDPTAITATTHYRRGARRDGSCAFAYSAAVVKTVITNVTSPGTITGAETQCAGFDPALITSTAASGGAGGTITYQWQTSPDGATWTDVTGATAATYDPTAITATTHYRRGARRDGSCAFAYSAAVVKTVITNVTSPGTITGTETECAGFDPMLITSTAASGGAGGTIAYQWQSSPDGATWADIAGATAATYDPTAITATTHYRRGARRDGSCAFLYSAGVVKTVITNVTSPGTIAGAETQCAGFDPTLITSTAASGGAGGTIAYQWQSSSDGTTWTDVTSATATTYDPAAITATTQYRRGARRDGSCAFLYSAAVIKTVISNVTSPGTITGAETECASFNPALITSTAASGGAGGTIAYQWQSSLDGSTWTDIAGASAATYDPTAITATTHYRRGARRDGSCAFAYSAGVVKTVITNVTSPGTIAGAETECAGFDPGLITSTAASGGAGGTIAYQWQSSPDGTTWADIAGATAATYDPTAVTATTHYRRGARRDGSCAFAYSAGVVKTVITNVTSPGTITGAETECAGFDPGLITSTAASGGSGGTIAYQWQSSPDGTTWTDITGATATTYDPTAITATTHYRRGARRDGSCAFSYSAGHQAARTIAYQWQSSLDGSTWTDIAGATAATYDPTAIVKTVISNVTSPGTIAGAETQCAGFDPGLITSTAASGGAGGTIAYQWQFSLDGSTWADIAGATAATYDPTAITATTHYRRGARRDGSCAFLYSAGVIKTVITNVTSPGTIAGAETECAGFDPGLITSTAASGGAGGTIAYQWQSSPDGTTWSDIAGATAATYDPTAITATTHYRRGARRDGSCAFAYSAAVVKTVITNVTSPGTIAGAETQCAGFDPALITSTAASGGSGGTIAYQWQSSPDGATWADIAGATAATYDPTAITSTTHYRRGARRDGSCAYVYTAAVVKTVHATPSVSAGSNQTICAGSSTTLTAVGSSGASPYTYSWTPGGLTGASVTVSPTATQDYTVTLTDAVGCTASSVVRVNVNPLPAATATATNPTLCAGTNGRIRFSFPDEPTRTAIAFSVNGGSTWASTPDAAGTYDVTGLAAGTYSLRVRWDNGDCPVNLGSLTLSDPSAPVATFSTSGPDDCNGATETFTATDVPGATYAWSFGASALPTTATGRIATARLFTSAGVDNISVTLTVTLAGCTSTSTQTVRRRTSPVAQISSAVATGPTTCGGANGQIALVAPDPSGSCMQFSVNGGTTWTTSRTITGLAAGTYTLLAQYCNAECTETYATAFTLVDPSPPNVSAGADRVICSGTPTTLTATATAGTAPYTYTWSPGGLTGAAVTVSPTVSQSYTVTATDARGCTATDVVDVTTGNGSFDSVYVRDLDNPTAPRVRLASGGRYHLSLLPARWNLETRTSGTVGAVRYALTGTQAIAGTTTAAPYAFAAPGAPLGLAAGPYQLIVEVKVGAAAADAVCATATVDFILEDYEICTNGVDDDGDGLTDCEDQDCEPAPVVTRVFRP